MSQNEGDCRTGTYRIRIFEKMGLESAGAAILHRSLAAPAETYFLDALHQIHPPLRGAAVLFFKMFEDISMVNLF